MGDGHDHVSSERLEPYLEIVYESVRGNLRATGKLVRPIFHMPSPGESLLAGRQRDDFEKQSVERNKRRAPV